MPQLIQTTIDLSPVIAIILVYIMLRGDIKSLHIQLHNLKENVNSRFDDFNARFDDLKENVNSRFDDFKEYNRLNQQQFTSLSDKVDNLSAQVNRIEGALNLRRTGTEG